MLNRIVFALTMTVAPQAAFPQDFVRAAIYFANGLSAYAECVKLGYKVDPNAWFALMGHEAPDVSPDDFKRDGRYYELGNLATNSVISKIEAMGAEAWCSSMAAWAAKEHPVVGEGLISISPSSGGEDWDPQN